MPLSNRDGEDFQLEQNVYNLRCTKAGSLSHGQYEPPFSRVVTPHCTTCHRVGVCEDGNRKNSHRQPEVLWAQRSGKVYLTISLPDAKDVSVTPESTGIFAFSAVGAHGEPFSFTLHLFGNILPQACKTKISLRNIRCSIQKEQKSWWPRLLKSENKPAPFLKVDWNKWCDEDDEESSDLDTDDDFCVYREEDESSDDGGMLYLPDLEKARASY